MQNLTAISQTGEGSTGAITIGGAATITGATTLTGAQTFTGAATFSTTIGVSGTATMAAINASGLFSGVKAVLSSTLGVSGTSTLAAVNASGLDSGVAATLSSTLTVAEPLTPTGGITMPAVHLDKGINFASMTPDFGSADDAFIAIGTYTSGFVVTDTGATFVPIQVNLTSRGNAATAGNQVAAARLRVNNDTAAQANTAIHVLQLRSDISKDCYTAACLNASMNVSANLAVAGESVHSAYFSITGAGVITCSPTVNVLEAACRQTSPGAGVDNVAQFDMNSTGCTISNILQLTNYAGTVANAVDIAGAYTSFFTMETGADATYLLTAPSGTAIAAGNGISTTVMATTFGSIKCLIGGAVRYIPLYYNS